MIIDFQDIVLFNTVKEETDRLNERARRYHLAAMLTVNDLLKLITNGKMLCSFTWEDQNCHFDFFIPPGWGHGGAYKGNIYIISEGCRIRKGGLNPFTWGTKGYVAKNFINAEVFANTVERLAADNDLTKADFVDYVDWCDQHRQWYEDSDWDPRPSIEIWREQKINSPIIH